MTAERVSIGSSAPEPLAPWQEPAPGDGSGLHELTALGDALVARAHADARGKAAHLVVKTPLLRATVIALTAGSGLPEHNSPPAATLQSLRGQAVLRSDIDRWELTTGSLVPIPPERHAVDAVSDCVLLLTVAAG